MSKTKATAGQANYYARYKANRVWEKNRIAKLQRTLKKQPNNLQVQAALKAGPVYRRKTPKTKVWSASWVATAVLLKQFSGVFDPNCMSANKEKADQALRRTKNSGFVVQGNESKFFTLATRVMK